MSSKKKELVEEATTQNSALEYSKTSALPQTPSPAFVNSDAHSLSDSSQSITGSSYTQSEPNSSPRVLAGRYTLLELLGEGGMGQVYRANDQQLNEVVALKLLHPDMLANQKAVHRFKQEVRLARRVTHRNVARTYDLGEANNSYFLTMEFVDGESLTARIKRNRRLSVAETVEIGVAICEGLEAAHQEKIVHRDLKPDNILLASDGRVVLTDFGIARLETSSGDEFKTAMGTVIGTPTYMAPEQIEGKGKIDARTDLYALGCILFEMLVGSPAWLGNDFIVLATARFMQPAPDPRSRKKDIPEAVAKLVMRCMDRHPDKRYGSATEVATALQNLDNKPQVSLHTGQNFLTALPTSSASTSHNPWSTGTAQAVLKPDSNSISVAVLPFRVQGEANKDYIQEGLMDDLIDTLSMTEGLEVRARGMVKSYQGQDFDPIEAGRELGVDVIIAGSIQQMGDRLRIRTQLISAQDGNQLWAQRFQTSTSEFFDTSDTIAQEVAQALQVDISLPQRAASRNSTAIDLYLRARYELRRAWTSDVTPAIQLFDQARELSPDDPQILAGAAVARARFAFWSNSQEEELASALVLAERAVSVDPKRPETLFALAMVRFLETRFSAAINLLETAIELNPTYADAHDLLGRLHQEFGPLEKAIYHLRLALSLDPTILSARWDLMRDYALQQRWDRVEELYILPVTVPTDIAVRAIVSSRLFLWHPQPRRVEHIPDIANPHITQGVLRYHRVIEQGGLSEQDYQDFLHQIREAHSPRLKTIQYQMLSEQLAFSQRWEAAMDIIQRSIDLELWDQVWLSHCPLFLPLQGNPRFQDLQSQLSSKIAPRLQDR